LALYQENVGASTTIFVVYQSKEVSV